MVRAQPMDAVVLIGGCDKTIPAQLMAAASASVPALVLPTGPMMTGHWRGERLGACTDCRRFWGMYRAGALDDAEIEDVEETAALRERWSPPPAHPGSERGYLRLFLDAVTGADRGCDFGFMGRPDASVPPTPSGRPGAPGA